MKKFNQYIIEKLKISRNNFKEYDWDDFVELFRNYNKGLYFDEFCEVSKLETRPYYINNVTAVDLTYIYCNKDNDIILWYYNPIRDADNYVVLEDFLDIEKLFKGDDIIEKIIDYIS